MKAKHKADREDITLIILRQPASSQGEWGLFCNQVSPVPIVLSASELVPLHGWTVR